MKLKYVALLFVLMGWLTACSDDDPIDEPDAGLDDTGADAQTFDDAHTDADSDDADVDDAPDAAHPDADADADADAGEVDLDYPLADCDELDPAVCSFPWPSNLYLAPTSQHPTGYQLQFGETTLPANNQGEHISPHLFEGFDGFGLGVPIMVQFPDLDDTELPHEYEIEDSMSADAQILLFQVTDQGLERIPYFAELDRAEQDPSLRTLFVRPAVILKTNTRYVVAFRDLLDTSGDSIEPSPAFQALVDGDTAEDPVLTHRQARFDEVFELLEDEGLDRDSLTLAWDFVTASSEALHGSMLDIRDDAFEWVDEEGIAWHDIETEEFIPEPDSTSSLAVDEFIALEMHATIEVPHYMEPYEGSSNAWQLHRDESGQITQNQTRHTDIMVRIPHRALEGDDIGVIVYGHGLLGSRHGVGSEHLSQLAETYGYAIIGVDLAGMSSEDIDATLDAVLNLNHFVAIGDRLHQGLLEYLLTIRTAGDELTELEDLTSRDITIDADDIYYFGASQGGIFGHSVMALTPDIERGYLAVPGNNYSTLLQRSINFDDFDDAMALAYPTMTDRQINIAAMNLLWARTEPVSYARHIRHEPFDGHATDVLLAVAKGDWQVATITNENTARTSIEIPLLENYDTDRDPYGVDIATYPHSGSGTVLFDFGNPWPPPGNLTPEDEVGDPHGRLVEVDDAGHQIDVFFRDGQIIDICNGQPCRISDL